MKLVVPVLMGLFISMGGFAQERYTKTMNDTIFVVGDLLLGPGIHFCDGRLCESAGDSIDQLTWFFERNPYIVAELVYHTDVRGDEEFNRTTSLRKAAIITQAVTASDSIVDERIVPVGYGERYPLYSADFIARASVDSAEYYHGRNFRLEIHVTGVLPSDFYHHYGEASRLNDSLYYRTTTDYATLVLIADRALLEGDLAKALKFYELADEIGPADDPYPATQARQIRALMTGEQKKEDD